MSATGQTGEYDDWELEEFWPKDGPYSSSADLNAIPKNPDYWQSGFLSIQWAIGQIAINQVRDKFKSKVTPIQIVHYHPNLCIYIV